MENQTRKLDKAVKISIIMGVLIISLSVAYYLVIFLSQKEKIRVEQRAKEYVAKRKGACLQIYKTENNKWNNVNGYEYNEKLDKCYVLYKSQESQRSGEECNKIKEHMLKTGADIKNIESIASLFFTDCLNNEYRRSF